jgi:hypothetical protein
VLVDDDAPVLGVEVDVGVVDVESRSSTRGSEPGM